MPALALVLLSGHSAWAQNLPVYESTGTIELAIDGKSSTYHTTSNTVPGQPGRMVHTANWRTFAPMMLGGINMAPPGVFISLSARPTVEPDPDAPQLKITFSIDDGNHTLLETAPTEVSYTIKNGALAGQYQHASGSLQILSVQAADNNTLKITGRAAGTLSSKGGGKGARQELEYAAEFTVNAHRH